MPAFVRETSGGTWEVVQDDVVRSTHDSQVDALNAALALNGGKTKDAILRDPDTKELNGAWRWLHATDVEDVPAYDGARIDETTVAQAVKDLNAAPLARPVNGGTSDSPGHGHAGQTLANGYAHHAVEVVASDGRHGAYVIAELVPDVARNVDSGRIAFTSIGLGGSVAEGEDAIRDAVFDHLALTNTPAVTTLTPSAAIRKAGDRFVAVRTRPINRAAKALRNTMAKTSVRSEIVTPLALRGPALDALTSLCASIGISIDDELSADDWASPSKEALCALRMIAKSERIVEGLSGASAVAARSARAGIVRSIAKRAEVADADLEAMAKKLGLPAGASFADMVAAIDKMEPKKVPADDAAAAKTEATEAVRAQKLVDLETQVATLTADKLAREDETWLDGEATRLGVVVRTETRPKLLKLLRADRTEGRGLVTEHLSGLPKPPVGTVIRNDGHSTDPLATTATDVTEAAIEAELVAVRSAYPKEPKHMQWARARKAARSKDPRFATAG